MSKRGTEFNTFYEKRIDGTYRYWTSSSYLASRSTDTVKLWRVGLKGGVKVLYDETLTGRYGYITQDPEGMKEFMWAKLSAINTI